MKKIGLDYDAVTKINPRIVYGTVTGYGTVGPWTRSQVRTCCCSPYQELHG